MLNSADWLLSHGLSTPVYFSFLHIALSHLYHTHPPTPEKREKKKIPGFVTQGERKIQPLRLGDPALH